jgi:SAM-dependent methyltransferase
VASNADANDKTNREGNVTNSDADKVFAGSIPKIYETHLVPLIFEPYAADMAKRLSSRPLTRVLEVAAGTGVVTRALASSLPEVVSIVATDLNQAMLDHAAAMGTSRPVEWRQADAMQLPFDDETFDAVVCQFGVMFIPVNVWDRISENEFADEASAAMELHFPDDPPRFLVRAPYAYFDRSVIEQDLAAGGFTKSPRFETVTVRSRAASPKIPAMGFCQGSPLRNEIEARDPSGLGKATDVAEEVIAKRFGRGEVDAKIQAHVVAVER